MQLHWHRRDLRVSDNRALAAAADDADSRGEVVPVFVFDELILEHGAAPRVRYMLDALAELRERYRDRGSDLVVVRGDPSTLLVDLAEEFDAERVVWNDDYSGLAEERDEAVRAALSDAEVEYDSFCDQVHHEPGEIRTNAGDPYSVFTYFWKKWRDRDKADPYPEPEESELASIDEDDEIPTIDELGFEEPEADVQTAGTEAARERLATFCDDAIFRYEEDRDYPTRDATSKLSADLKWGTIGIREVYDATEEAKNDAGSDEAESVEEFQSQLAWREFYTQVLYFNQSVVSENYKEYQNGIEWNDDEEGLQAWKEGKTGYPIVDAGMRQLREEAYMHNRLRMIVASFLTKDLLVDWREGYDHFRALLADHDTGNDNGGWQWAASTGTDAQPYFRVFNPMTQGERYDPDAEYIKSYVPELAGVDADTIHSWHELSDADREDAAPDYPAPVVDHSERREEAIAMFERARGEADD
ncbi:deoxyribodipyrimidine photolyase [Haloprofundus marisrubri]|uniref:Deoxyribodipyrimidine photolyase n=1 Tax=Haloprofundus marisrubri TaxID=1514971 RepID=A0A0W1R5K6_9EURY|nr:deoxyribodipyrimidine photo-lyase [Haloprofundus marisrubri]KTG08365.1 deoxyribodipyrimidine photolyase [Haloprofundus marisrubri]